MCDIGCILTGGFENGLVYFLILCVFPIALGSEFSISITLLIGIAKHFEAKLTHENLRKRGESEDYNQFDSINEEDITVLVEDGTSDIDVGTASTESNNDLECHPIDDQKTTPIIDENEPGIEEPRKGTKETQTFLGPTLGMQVSILIFKYVVPLIPVLILTFAIWYQFAYFENYVKCQNEFETTNLFGIPSPSSCGNLDATVLFGQMSVPKGNVLTTSYINFARILYYMHVAGGMIYSICYWYPLNLFNAQFTTSEPVSDDDYHNFKIQLNSNKWILAVLGIHNISRPTETKQEKWLPILIHNCKHGFQECSNVELPFLLRNIAEFMMGLVVLLLYLSLSMFVIPFVIVGIANRSFYTDYVKLINSKTLVQYCLDSNNVEALRISLDAGMPVSVNVEIWNTLYSSDDSSEFRDCLEMLMTKRPKYDLNWKPAYTGAPTIQELLVKRSYQIENLELGTG